MVKWGGDCLNTGCVPSKTLIASAHAMEHINTASSFGVNVGPSHLDYTTVHSRVHEIISEIAPHDSVERYRKLGIDVYEEYAEFIDGHTIRLLNHVISARRIVIATGSSPRVPTIDGVECAHVYTSDTIWERKTLPNNLVVIGAGPIGSELAMAYAQLGSTVHLVESSTRLLGILPKDQAEIVVAALKRRGVILHYNTSVSRISEHHVSIGYQEVKADAVLIATGREPNTA
ncbi:MAG: FAD-dependent oxidoreductase, partial [Gammaproteobacteria bacterium]|nr:FAD-dependent oxidoreductase [Gammaproteobacteria bacterium]